MRILIVKLTSFGDVIHTFPAITDLKAAHPSAEIDWLVEEAFAPFVALHPAVDTIHTFAFRKLRSKAVNWPRLSGEALKLSRKLRARKYDLVVDLQGLMKSALPALLARAPVAGYDSDSAREPAASRLYRYKYAVPRDMHAVERSRRLLAAAVGDPLPLETGRYGLQVPAGSGQDQVPLPDRYMLAMHAASWDTKLWPERNWRSLFADVVGAGCAVVLPWGSDEEAERARRLALDFDNVHILPTVLSGAPLARLLSGAEFAVGLDSGLMHLAAALDVPGVWLFGPTDPGRTGPYGRDQTVLRSAWPEAPCYRRSCDAVQGGRCCMKAIDVYGVADTVNDLLARTHGSV